MKSQQNRIELVSRPEVSGGDEAPGLVLSAVAVLAPVLEQVLDHGHVQLGGLHAIPDGLRFPAQINRQ